MRHKNLLVSLSLLAGAPVAQTTGVPFVNNLTVTTSAWTAQGGGQTSCFMVTPNAAYPPGVVNYALSIPPGTSAVLGLSIGPGGCVSQFLPFLPPASVGCAGPLAGTPSTNLWWSLPFLSSGFPIFIPMAVNTAGVMASTVPIGILGPQILWAQAVIVDPCAPSGFKFSQAIGFAW